MSQQRDSVKVAVVSHLNIDFGWKKEMKFENENKNACRYNQYFLFMPPHRLFLLIEKSIELELSNLKRREREREAERQRGERVAAKSILRYCLI